MLGKLIKHEFFATGRRLLPLCLVSLILGALANLGNQAQLSGATGVAEFWSVLIQGLFFVALFAVVIGGFILLVQRFYANLLTDEGYLMFALPVSPHHLVLAKLITAVVWSLIITLVVFLSLVIYVLRSGDLSQFFRLLIEAVPLLTGRQAATLGSVFAECLLLGLLGFAGGYLVFYAALALGHSFARHKGLLSVVFFCLFGVLLQVFLWLLVLVPNPVPSTITDPITLTHIVLWISIALEAAVGAVFYFLTVFALKRRLNLE